MKKISLLAVFTVSNLFVSAQSIFAYQEETVYKKLRVDFGWAYVKGLGDKESGASLMLEPKFQYNDNLSLGLKWEFVFLLLNPVFNDGKGEFAVFKNIKFIGDFHFKPKSELRPFVGLGFGNYKTASLSFGSDNESFAALESWGLTPRIGIDANHIRLFIAYNVLFSKQKLYTFESGIGVEKGTQSRDYLELGLNFYIGGGKK